MTTKRERKPLPTITTTGSTFLIVDQTAGTLNRSIVVGTREEAERAGMERLAALNSDRPVFIFEKVAVCSSAPRIDRLGPEPEPNQAVRYTDFSRADETETPGG